MKTYQVTLPDEVVEVVDGMLAEGNWDSIDHMFAYALLQLREEIEADADQDLEALRKAIQVGIDQSDRSESAPLDMDAIWARVQRKLEAEKEIAHAPGDANPTGR